MIALCLDALKIETDFREEASQTMIDGSTPTCPVATIGVSELTDRLTISSECEVKCLCVFVVVLWLEIY